MERFAILAGTATRYYVSDAISDDKPVVMLIHGYMESIESWDGLIRRLEPHVAVVALDLPGHGISEVPSDICTMSYFADTACALLDKLSIDKAAVVGHSMGGYVACAFAARYPERCSALVLLHSSPLADTPERAADRLREIAVIEQGRKELLTSVNPSRSFAPCNVDRMEETIDALSEQAMMTDNNGILAALRGMMEREDLSKRLAELHIPQSAVFGTDDLFIPEAAREKIISETPYMTHHIIPDTGHQAHHEATGKVAKIILDITE